MAQQWVMKVESEETWTLEDPGEGWISPDRKLAAALARVAAGEIGRQLTQHNTTALSNNQVIRGRVLLAMVFGTTRLGQMATRCMT